MVIAFILINREVVKLKFKFAKINQLFLIILFLSLLVCSNAYAHRVNVFAYVEGDTIFSESYFSKKKRVHQGKIEIRNLKDDKVLLEGITDDDGNYNFKIPEEIKSTKSGLKLILHASEGHRGEWTLTADEIFPDSAAASVSQENNDSEVVTKTTPPDISSSELSDLKEEIRALNSKIDTVKRMHIDQQEKGPGVHEIFSGIGYIFGLFGVAAFFSSRKK